MKTAIQVVETKPTTEIFQGTLFWLKSVNQKLGKYIHQQASGKSHQNRLENKGVVVTRGSVDKMAKTDKEP